MSAGTSGMARAFLNHSCAVQRGLNAENPLRLTSLAKLAKYGGATEWSNIFQDFPQRQAGGAGAQIVALGSVPSRSLRRLAETSSRLPR
eukprot:4071742-Pyramimonas_sp.AAC.1